MGSCEARRSMIRISALVLTSNRYLRWFNCPASPKSKRFSCPWAAMTGWSDTSFVISGRLALSKHSHLMNDTCLKGVRSGYFQPIGLADGKNVRGAFVSILGPDPFDIPRSQP